MSNLVPHTSSYPLPRPPTDGRSRGRGAATLRPGIHDGGGDDDYDEYDDVVDDEITSHAYMY